MSYRAAFKRLYYIVEKIKVNKGITAFKILESLQEKGLEISSATLERDLKSLREEFFCKITYKRNLRGYEFEGFLNPMMEQLLNNNAQTFLLLDMDKEKLLQEFVISDGAIPDHVNSTFLTILDALAQNKKIKITHTKPNTSIPQQYVLHPIIVKEYQYKRYLIALKENMEKRAFHIGRISSVEILNQEADTSQRAQIKNQLKNTLGVINFDKIPEEIIFISTKDRAKFLKEKPLHSSQIVVQEVEDVVVFKLNVVINLELIAELLSLGEHIRIASPASLIEQLKSRFELILEQHTNEKINIEKIKQNFKL